MRHAADMRGTNTVVRRSSTATNRTDKNGLTVRAKTLYETGEPSEADIPWTRGIYRQIDLTQKREKNMPLYYPEEIIDGQENLFRVLLGLVASNKIRFMISRWSKYSPGIRGEVERYARTFPYPLQK